MSKNLSEMNLSKMNLSNIVGVLAKFLQHSGMDSQVLPHSITAKPNPGNTPPATPPTTFTPAYNGNGLIDFKLDGVYTDEELLALVGANEDQRIAMGLTPANPTAKVR